MSHHVTHDRHLTVMIVSACHASFLCKMIIVFRKVMSYVSHERIVHYDTCALSSPLLHGVKLGPERSEGPITPCNGLLKTLVSYNIL